ncbi:ABC transporter substrate-binding protein [Rhodoferax sp.]|uniref:ABC transporter substrate-binding protein n=1 Tax=Rhodoferax sp. TaxID=50421 RepID=UPI00374D3013
MAQIVDNTPSQLDVSRDFLIGSRAAWQEINKNGGVNGRVVQHLVLEVDASAESLRAALDTVQKTANCVVLSGTAGDRAASQLVALLKHDQHNIAHVAPWLQNSDLDGDQRTFPIFASRQDQIAQAIKSLSLMGIPEIGAVYASEQEYTLYRNDVERASTALKIKLMSFKPTGGVAQVGKSLNADTPRILLFMGGTPELVQFTQSIEKQARQRYVLALADVNLQTLMQMGASRQTPIMATQVVPMVNASLPIVKSYRQTLARLFDEPPTPQSLAGYIAARYTSEVLSTVEGALTRQTALLAFQRRQVVDLSGFRVSFNAQGRGGSYVTQSMVTPDGRLVG